MKSHEDTRKSIYAHPGFLRPPWEEDTLGETRNRCQSWTKMVNMSCVPGPRGITRGSILNRGQNARGQVGNTRLCGLPEELSRRISPVQVGLRPTEGWHSASLLQCSATQNRHNFPPFFSPATPERGTVWHCRKCGGRVGRAHRFFERPKRPQDEEETLREAVGDRGRKY